MNVYVDSFSITNSAFQFNGTEIPPQTLSGVVKDNVHVNGLSTINVEVIFELSLTELEFEVLKDHCLGTGLTLNSNGKFKLSSQNPVGVDHPTSYSNTISK